VLNNESIDEIRITAVFQHAHLLASGIRTRHFRNGTELKPIYDDPNYDFYFQEMRPLKEEVVIKKVSQPDWYKIISYFVFSYLLVKIRTGYKHLIESDN
jgi:hypothetical protein